MLHYRMFMGKHIVSGVSFRVALFGTATVTGYALFGTVKNLVTEHLAL